MTFHVYIYLDLRKPGRFSYGGLSFLYEPFYVGKGRGRRWHKTSFRSNHVLNLMRLLGDPSTYAVVLPCDSESESVIFEMDWIHRIGRRCDGSGPLLNLTLGGEGTSGYKFTDEQRRKVSEAMKVIPKTPEWRQRLSLSQIGKPRKRSVAISA